MFKLERQYELLKSEVVTSEEMLKLGTKMGKYYQRKVKWYMINIEYICNHLLLGAKFMAFIVVMMLLDILYLNILSKFDAPQNIESGNYWF